MFFSHIFELIGIGQKKRLDPIPKRIYSLWIQGETVAPDIVKLNWNRWQYLNPDYELVILDRAAALGHIGTFPIDPSSLTPQAFSDVLRVHLLAEFGGIWTDASVFPVVPLSEWIEICLRKSTFFAYETPGKDRPLSSWFLAARQNSIIMRAWCEAVKAYWYKTRRIALDKKGNWIIPEDTVAAVSPRVGALEDTYPYFWFHYLFTYLLATNQTFQEDWQLRTRKSASQPHKLQALIKEKPHARENEIFESAKSAEMQKLNWQASNPIHILKRI